MKERPQITKDGPGEIGIEMGAEEPPPWREISGGFGSEFCRAAAEILSLKTRNRGRGENYNAPKTGHRGSEMYRYP